jgi:hypothetical protein
VLVDLLELRSGSLVLTDHATRLTSQILQLTLVLISDCRSPSIFVYVQFLPIEFLYKGILNFNDRCVGVVHVLTYFVSWGNVTYLKYMARSVTLF